MDAGVLIVRLVFGAVMAAHGAQKLFGWFGGYGLTGTGGFFEQLGFRPGRIFAGAAGAAEVAGGLLVALGLLGPVGPALIVSVMVVATATVHWVHGLFAQDGGFEVPLLYSAAVIGLAATGFGAYSLDDVLGLTPLWTPAVTLGILAIGLIGGIANLGLRRPTAPATAAA